MPLQNHKSLISEVKLKKLDYQSNSRSKTDAGQSSSKNNNNQNVSPNPTEKSIETVDFSGQIGASTAQSKRDTTRESILGASTAQSKRDTTRESILGASTAQSKRDTTRESMLGASTAQSKRDTTRESILGASTAQSKRDTTRESMLGASTAQSKRDTTRESMLGASTAQSKRDTTRESMLGASTAQSKRDTTRESILGASTAQSKRDTTRESMLGASTAQSKRVATRESMSEKNKLTFGEIQKIDPFVREKVEKRAEYESQNKTISNGLDMSSYPTTGQYDHEKGLERAILFAKYLVMYGGFTPVQAAAIAGTALHDNGCFPGSVMEAEKNGLGAPGTGGNGYGAGIGSWSLESYKIKCLEDAGYSPNTKIEDLTFKEQCDMLIKNSNSYMKYYYDALRRCDNIVDASATAQIITGGIGFSNNWSTHPTVEEAKRMGQYYAAANNQRYGYSEYHNSNYEGKLSCIEEVYGALMNELSTNNPQQAIDFPKSKTEES